MADIVTSSEELKVDFLFVDGDNRTQTLKNPKSTITTEEIDELNAFIRANNLVIGDKGNGTFGKIQKVRRVSVLKTKLDLTA